MNATMLYHPILKLFMGYAVRPEEEKEEKLSPLVGLLGEIWSSVRQASLPPRTAQCDHPACLLSAKELVDAFEERMATDEVASLLYSDSVQTGLESMKERVARYLTGRLEADQEAGGAEEEEGEEDFCMVLARDDPVNGCFLLVSYDSWVNQFVPRSAAATRLQRLRGGAEPVMRKWLQNKKHAAWVQVQYNIQHTLYSYCTCCSGSLQSTASTRSSPRWIQAAREFCKGFIGCHSKPTKRRITLH
jgi:hypothetical protein